MDDAPWAAADDDDDYANCADLPLPKSPVKKPLPPVPAKKASPPKNTATVSSSPQARPCHLTDDLGHLRAFNV